ncbi:MAG: site-specific DNA-methyltransferase [Candidatus Omnitrophica bacterium]|nr:site-specific DNA-methyltransferase [Candidatus Omnitrophota bacterium]
MEKVNKVVKTDFKERLKEIYPEVFEDNKVNFDKLKNLLSGEIIQKEDDRFYFNWAGKSQLFKLIQAPAYGTLKPVKEKSVDFDKTENIVIIGENLETLKLLLKPYFGKVKMIYIDPPYNTGKDFIYRDNFKQPLKDYLEKTGQIDSEGKKLTTNTEASGRYHSDWLNFIYPRLFLSRSLLRDDGVIFVSIDDHEVHHLRMIMDEIFGEENFVDLLIWRKKSGGGQDDEYFAKEHEYILTYRKNKDFKLVEETYADDINDYPYEDERGRYKIMKLEKWGAGAYKKDAPSLFYPIKDPDGNDYYPIAPDGREGRWRKKPEDVIKEKRIEWKKTKKGWTPYEKIYYNPDKEKIKKERTILYNLAENTDGTNELKEIFGRKDIYSNPKPTELIKYLIKLSSTADSFILDFFAGSGTTGQAVWDLNKEDGGNRKFILVQLDEEVQDEEIKKEFPTVADICIERLRRVSEKYKKENNNQDFGFKVFKLDKSNFNLKDEFEFDPQEDKEELKKKYLEWLGMYVNQPLVPGWKEIDVIYEVILKEGLNLNSKIEKIKIKNCEFYYVKDETQELDFYIYLKDKIDKETIEEIRTTKYKGKMFVFLDNALADSDKINLSAFVRLKVI